MRSLQYRTRGRRRQACGVAAVTVSLIFAVATTGAAQSLASVQGFVSDETGAFLPGVTVELVDLERGQRRMAVTNRQGLFVLRAIPGGRYDLVATLEGFRTTRRENIRLLVGQSLDVDLRLGLASVEETVLVVGETPLLEVGRAGVAGYVNEEEIANLPISGRDFVRFALLMPTVQVDARGRLSFSGQRAVNSGFTIDGADAKSAFFGFGRGGLAREGGGALVAQESVQEFQVVTSGYSAEAGRSGGGAMNVITKSGTNDLAGSVVLFGRDDQLAARLPRSPLDAARGVPADDSRYEVDEFRRYNWGASLGGPIRRDRTHFFVSYDQTAQNQPFLRHIRGRGQYDAVLGSFPELLAGYVPNDDGAAAADPHNGRTASGRFVRETDNLILFGKLNHRATDRHSLALRYNFTRYSRVSDFVGEESRRFVRSHSTVGELVSVVGRNGVNELRAQFAYDDFDRRSHLPDSALQAHFSIFYPSFGSFGKPWWLPVSNDEHKLEIQERFSYVSGNHELRAGFSLSHDALSEFFAGNADGNYDFDTLQDFAAGTPARAIIFFGIMENPNFEVSQQILGAYVQDSWSPSRSLTLQIGARWDGTLNPGGIEHVLPAGRRIPDDLDNFSPRAGVVWSPDSRSVVRASAGVFYARTPTLLFSTAHSDTGIYPRYGNAIVSPGDTGFVPLGSPIANDSPPAGLIPALSHFDPGFEDPRTIRVNVGYERELGGNLAASFDLLHARGDSLASNFDANVPAPTRDPFGRPVYAGKRINPAYGPILVRASPARSDYLALTAGLRRRFSDGVQFQAHYTWSRDRSNDDNERSGSLTLTDPTDPDYDWGLSIRDIPHRLVASGIFALPFDVTASAILTAQSGAPFTALDPAVGFHNHPGFAIGPHGAQTRAVVDGELAPVNGERNASWTNLDLRLTRHFQLAGARVEGLFEVFNLLNTGAFRVGHADQQEVFQNDGVTPNPEFGLAGVLVGAPRQAQLGLRIAF
ncbi:MAG: TonB-dependent receptor [Acidobacteria bacterium]|nr:TonB-dependent receptor [Acidobacteriota bacterium]